MIKRYKRGQAIVLGLSLVAALFFCEKPALLRAEGELSLNLSAYEVELGSGEAVTINVSYSAAGAVQNTKVSLDRSQAAAFSVQDHLSESGASVNGGGSLGSVTVIAPSENATGTLVLQAVATRADDSSVQYTAQAELVLRVNLPEAAPAEGENLAVETPPGNIRVRLNGSSEILPQINNDAPENLPEAYAESSLDIQGQTLKSYTRSGRLPLIYLNLVPNGAPALYSFDEASQSIYRFYPDIETQIGGKTALVQSVVEPSPHRQFVSQTFELGGQVTTAFVGESYGREYTLLRASLAGAAPQLYLYQLNALGQAELVTYSLAELLKPPATPSPDPSAAAAAGTETSVTAASANSASASAKSSKLDWIYIGLWLILLLMSAGLVWLFLRTKAKNEAENRRRLKEAYERVQGGGLPASSERRDPRAQAQRRPGAAPARSRPRQEPRPLRELTPNDFDNVDRYFAERPAEQRHGGSRAPLPEVRSGVRSPSIRSTPPHSGQNRRADNAPRDRRPEPHGHPARPRHAQSSPPPPIRRVGENGRGVSDHERF